MGTEIMQIHFNRLAGGPVEEKSPTAEPSRWDAVADFFHPGTYCVRRCDIYAGNYTLHTKADMEERGECGKPERVAYMGRYSDCSKFLRANQTYEYWAN